MWLLLTLNLQLALLRAEPGFTRLRHRVREIAGALEEISGIPMVDQQLALIQDVQSDPWWEDVTLPMLKTVRRRLTAQGFMPIERLCDAPFTDLNPAGVDGVFASDEVDALLGALQEVRWRGVA